MVTNACSLTKVLAAARQLQLLAKTLKHQSHQKTKGSKGSAKGRKRKKKGKDKKKTNQSMASPAVFMALIATATLLLPRVEARGQLDLHLSNEALHESSPTAFASWEETPEWHGMVSTRRCGQSSVRFGKTDVHKIPGPAWMWKTPPLLRQPGYRHPASVRHLDTQECAKSARKVAIKLASELGFSAQQNAHMLSCVGQRAVKWLIDTGASYNLIGREHVGASQLKAARQLATPVNLNTANGPITVTDEIPMRVDSLPSLNNAWAIVLDEAPCVLSVGRLTANHGFDLTWRHDKAPYLKDPQTGQRIKLHVETAVPYLYEPSKGNKSQVLAFPFEEGGAPQALGPTLMLQSQSFRPRDPCSKDGWTHRMSVLSKSSTVLRLPFMTRPVGKGWPPCQYTMRPMDGRRLLRELVSLERTFLSAWTTS